MTPLQIQICNWGPYKGLQSFDFPTSPGLYFLWGRNDVDIRLGSNGAGKTRLWEALCWACFGKTSRGLIAGDVANWDQGKGAYVKFTYEHDSLTFTITRQWSPNSWTLTCDQSDLVIDLAAKDESNAVADHLRLDFNGFLNTILMAQGRPMFLDMKADAKAGLFSTLMGLDRWLERSQKASKRASEVDQECRELERQEARLTGQLEQLTRRQTTGQREAWESARRKKLDQLAELHEEAVGKQRRLKGELKLATDAEAAAREALRRAVAVEAPVQSYDLAQDWYLDSRDACAKLEADEDALRRDLAFLDEHETCPTCGQEMTQAHKEAEAGRAQYELEKIQKKISQAKQTTKEALETVKDLEWHLDEQRKVITQAERVVEQAERETRDLCLAVDHLDRELDGYERDAEAIAAEDNPHLAEERRLDDEARGVQRELGLLRRRLDDALGRYRVFTHWVKWFKELRLELISEALCQLEVEVNNQVTSMGLPDWELQFSVDRETASGALQRGFSVFVVSPHNPKPVPWEAWSGGEAQRLRVAAQCGLANLSRDHTGCDLNLEVWDEPTNGMSAQGVSDLLTSLRQRALDEGRQIWIVDHHSLSFGGFDGTAGVIKTKKGSSFDQSALYISGKEFGDEPSVNPDAESRAALDVVGVRAITARAPRKEPQ